MAAKSAAYFFPIDKNGSPRFLPWVPTSWEKAMEPFRLKLKVGVHEFEAEGTEESVKEQLAVWRELISSPGPSAPTLASPPPQASPPPPPADAGETPEADSFREDRRQFSKIFKHDGRVVSLTVLPKGPQSTPDALLLILFGQYVFNGPEPVSGQTISDGLAMSGVPVPRVDRAWGPHLGSNVLASGVRRGTRYRLSNTGLAKAREIAKQLLELVV